MSNLKIAALMVATAVGSVFLWDSLQDAPQIAVRVERVKEYVIAPPSAQAEPEFGPPLDSGSTPSGAPLPRPAAPKGNELGRALLEAKDVRAFVVEALKQPEKGGAFYATLALRQCQNFDPPQEVIQRVVAEDSTITADRMSRINAARDRCSQFTGDDIASMQAEALRLGAEGKDPLMAMQLQMIKARPGTPERNELLGAMLKTNVALASENFVAMRLLQQSMSVSADGGAVYRFDGQTYTDPADQAAIAAGARLSTCGADFCALDSEMAMYCKGLAGICYASREEYLLQTAFKGDRAALDKAQKFAEHMRAAMARGDTSVFK